MERGGLTQTDQTKQKVENATKLIKLQFHLLSEFLQQIC